MATASVLPCGTAPRGVEIQGITGIAQSRLAAIEQQDDSAHEPGQPGLPRVGELTVDNIKATIGPLLAESLPEFATDVQNEMALVREINTRQYTPTPLRLPTFCPGCPHRASVTLPSMGNALYSPHCV